MVLNYHLMILSKIKIKIKVSLNLLKLYSKKIHSIKILIYPRKETSLLRPLQIIKNHKQMHSLILRKLNLNFNFESDSFIDIKRSIIVLMKNEIFIQ